MPIHRDIQPLIAQLDDIQNTLIMRVYAKTNQQGYAEFSKWAVAFTDGAEETMDLWQQLRPHINFPV